MVTTASSIDTRHLMNPNNRIIKLKEYISGELCNESVEFLNSLCVKDDSSLDKLILKCQKYSINIKAKDLDLVIKALQVQTNLPGEILSTIHHHTHDNKVNGLANILNELADKLEQELPTIDTLHSIKSIVYGLQIFTNANPEEKFIKSLLLLLINFHSKQHNNSHNNYLDSAKWLKSLLAISEKSSLIQLVDYMAIRLSITKLTVHGDNYTMELTELFCALEEITNFVDIKTCHNKNIDLIKNISAVILITVICNRSPHAFVDVVVDQTRDKATNLYTLTKNFFDQDTPLQKFLGGNAFTLYYKDSYELPDINAQALLMCFSNAFHQELISKPNESVEMQLVKKFIINCNQNSEAMTDYEYKVFLTQQIINQQLIETFVDKILPSILVKLKHDSQRLTGINFIANKLASIGFSPRSLVFSYLGMFEPLIKKDKLQIDYKNICALRDYINNLDVHNKSIIVKELFISLLVRYRANPYKLENQPKPVHKKQVDNCYPIPTSHYPKYHEAGGKVGFEHANYQLTFFARKKLIEKNNAATQTLTHGKLKIGSIKESP